MLGNNRAPQVYKKVGATSRATSQNTHTLIGMV
jgi:hypothetical protein